MLLDLLFPNRCLQCGRIIPARVPVCDCCLQKIHFTRWVSFTENPLLDKCRLLFPISQAYALMFFHENSLSRKLIHEIKYNHRPILGEALAEWLFPYHSQMREIPDMMIPVPLHSRKLRERGYNQLGDFCKTLSSLWEIPCAEDVVMRNYYKKPQAQKGKLERSELGHLFQMVKPIEYHHILIVDDVFTTGNTIAAMAWEILKGKGNKVSVLVMAMD